MCGIGFIYVLVDVSGLVFDCIFMIMEFDGMFIIVCQFFQMVWFIFLFVYDGLYFIVLDGSSVYVCFVDFVI